MKYVLADGLVYKIPDQLFRIFLKDIATGKRNTAQAATAHGSVMGECIQADRFDSLDAERILKGEPNRFTNRFTNAELNGGWKQGYANTDSMAHFEEH